METFSIVIILLIAVLASSLLLRVSRLNIPLPLVQIAVGAMLGFIPGLVVQFDPHTFFLLFLPPLLFLDGWRIPKNNLLRDTRTVLSLSLGLVIFSVVGLAGLLKLLLPDMPLPVAFALAAVLSPTDPVAFSAVAKRTPIPKRLMHILEGESLLNDASGLVFFKFAVAAILTGTFSLYQAVTNFFYLSLGGLVVGMAVTYAIVRIKEVIARLYGEDPGVQILISLIIPFAAYQTAESLHCSGILAAVTAGIVMGYAEFYGQVQAVTRIRRNAVWDTVQYTLNGFIFVLLGKQFTHILLGAEKIFVGYEGAAMGRLFLYVGIVTIALIVLRLVWVYISFHITHLRTGFARRAEDRHSWRLFVATGLAGVRGAVTLAGVLSLPLTLDNGNPFPYREFCIFIAAGVIVFSMLTATLTLPYILRGANVLPEGDSRRRDEKARRAAAQAAIRAIEQAQHNMAEGRSDADLYTEAAHHVMEMYRLRIMHWDNPARAQTQFQKIESLEKELALTGLKAERQEIHRLARETKIDEEAYRRLVREIDLAEARYA
jgi:CPA1 family monovalent cation:H+ antiporter